jgi:hypothetical protein
MPIPSVMADLSTVAASNSPAGSESPISTDDFHRAIQAILRHTNAKGLDIASAATIDLGAATGEFVDITGTTTITSLGTVAAGIERTVRFTGALTLTHNATSLILPSSTNIPTANGDVAIFRSLGSGNWKCVSYIKQAGSPLALDNASVTNEKLNTDVFASNAEYVTGTNTTKALNPATARARNLVQGTVVTASGTSIDFTGLPAWVKRITIGIFGISTNGTASPIIQIGAGSVVTTGYAGTSATIGTSVSPTVAAMSNGFLLSPDNAAVVAYEGFITLVNISGNTWIMGSTIGRSAFATASMNTSGGRLTLTGTLDRVRLTTANGTDTFDAGSINIIYE